MRCPLPPPGRSLYGLGGRCGPDGHPDDAWDVSLASLQDHRKVATIGAKCNGCDHKRRWAIEELIGQHQPWTTVVELARRWKCDKCGSGDVLPFAIGR